MNRSAASATAKRWQKNNNMLPKTITFDSFARGILVALLVVAMLYLVNYLGSVLLPFFIAWLLAYLLHPSVCFVQNKLLVRNRAAAIILTLLFVTACIAAVVWMIIPPMIEQLGKLEGFVEAYLRNTTQNSDIATAVNEWLHENENEIRDFFHKRGITSTIEKMVPQVFQVISQTANIIISVVASFIMLIYLFFILLDYQNLCDGAKRLIPEKNRPFWFALIDDVEHEMNSYIRGQALVALCIGILFCIGFTIIDFPMAIGMGILIGVMSLVPYIHGLAFIPIALLSLLKAGDTGENFWTIFIAATVVFAIIQLITDLVLVPRIMGKAMRMSPAIILLSLSVWGALLGFAGLIIALPLTSLLLAYYKRYIAQEHHSVI